jgi:hypothetical protein
MEIIFDLFPQVDPAAGLSEMVVMSHFGRPDAPEIGCLTDPPGHSLGVDGNKR